MKTFLTSHPGSRDDSRVDGSLRFLVEFSAVWIHVVGVMGLVRVSSVGSMWWLGWCGTSWNLIRRTSLIWLGTVDES